MTNEEIAKIIKAINEAYKKKGKKITHATLYQGDNIETVIDERKDTDIN